MTPPTERDWQIRMHVYEFFVAQGRPPRASETSGELGMSEDEARAAYRRLHDAHAFFLEPGTDDIRLANPLSAVPTDYRVTMTADGSQHTANCAWDSLGVPAMLHTDATIDTVYTGSGEPALPAHYAIVDGALQGDDGLVHFPLPFRRWYDDLIHT